MPILPFAAVIVGRLGLTLQNGGWAARLLVVGPLAWAIVSTLAVHPHYLSYFNEAAGGPDNGHFHLIDSNIDWGQDLTYLHDWLQEHPEAKPLHLAYFNLIDARILGIEYTLPRFGPNGLYQEDKSYSRNHIGPQPGYYAVSVNLVRGEPFRIGDGRGGASLVPEFALNYFLRFKPIAKAGYSIFIYDISLEEANRVRQELGLPQLLEQPR